MIDVRSLVKHYGSVRAVDDVSFTASDGQITGLLGPNGAGKTTALRMITGLVKPQSGTVLVDGADVTQYPQGVRQLLGMQGDAGGVYPRQTPREQFRYYGKFYDMSSDVLEQRIDEVINMLGMAEIADRRAEGFSRGQRQKVIIGRALIHNPPNIIMDEPTNGLDVMAVRETRETIRRFRDQGRCVLFSTHYMDEADRLCDTIAIIVGGKIVAVGSPTELKERTGRDTLEDAFVVLADTDISVMADSYGVAGEQ